MLRNIKVLLSGDIDGILNHMVMSSKSDFD